MGGNKSGETDETPEEMSARMARETAEEAGVDLDDGTDEIYGPS